MVQPTLELSFPKARCFNRGNQVVYEKNGFRVTSTNCCSCICLPFIEQRYKEDIRQTRAIFEEAIKATFGENIAQTALEDADEDNPLTVEEFRRVKTIAVNSFHKKHKKTFSSFRFFKIFQQEHPASPLRQESFDFQEDCLLNVTVKTIDGKLVAFDEEKIREKILATSFEKEIVEEDIARVIQFVKEEIRDRQSNVIDFIEIEKILARYLLAMGYQMKKPPFFDSKVDKVNLFHRIDQLNEDQLRVVSNMIRKISHSD